MKITYRHYWNWTGLHVTTEQQFEHGAFPMGPYTYIGPVVPVRSKAVRYESRDFARRLRVTQGGFAPVRAYRNGRVWKRSAMAYGWPGHRKPVEAEFWW